MTDNKTADNSTNKQVHGFKAEVAQLLKLMIHSLYSNREIFLRELVSNASDAIDKLRFATLKSPELLGQDQTFRIQINADETARTLTISDNGIGMNQDEVLNNLGTIARSGTREFFTQLSGDQQKDAQLIGQFGVGFYSAFIVADKVVVNTRRADAKASDAICWTSNGEGEFTIEPISKDQRGTEVVLHLRSDSEFDTFLSSWQLKSLIRKYSDHISVPIEMREEKWDETEKKMLSTDAWQAVNEASALWTRNKNDVTPEQYQAFYQHISHDQEPALSYSHSRVEGRSEYTLLLFVPKKAPFDLWDRSQRHGLKLYVKRVFIMDDADKLLPTYLRFVRGVIDSADLPLNVSRELLQESRDVKTIREGATKKILSVLEEMANDKDGINDDTRYHDFWQEFGQVLKEGVGEDHSNRERLQKLLRFASTRNDDAAQTVSLADYVARMKHGQEKIYYVTADSYLAARNSPHLEVFKKKDIEVLLLSERVDEWMLSFLNEFDGKELVSVAKGGLDLGALSDESDKKAQELAQSSHKAVVEHFQTVLEDKVSSVRVTLRLTDSPACLVASEDGMSNHLQRILKSAGQAAPVTKPILEINPNHPLVAALTEQTQGLDDWAWLLFEEAQLAEGGSIENPAHFVARVNKLLLHRV